MKSFISNDLNTSYKFFKFHIDSDGNIILEGNLLKDLRDGEFQPEELLAYIGAALNILKKDYPKIMKILWTKNISGHGGIGRHATLRG